LSADVLADRGFVTPNRRHEISSGPKVLPHEATLTTRAGRSANRSTAQSSSAGTVSGNAQMFDDAHSLLPSLDDGFRHDNLR